MRFVASIVALVVMVVAGRNAVAAPKGVMYDCKITKRQKDVDWISPRLVIVMRNNQAPMVVDSVVLHFKGQPVAASVRRKGNTLQFRWTLNGASDSIGNRVPVFRYKAYLDTTNNTVKYSGTPKGYDSYFSGSGRCTPRENLTPRQLQKLLRS